VATNRPARRSAVLGAPPAQVRRLEGAALLPAPFSARCMIHAPSRGVVEARVSSIGKLGRSRALGESTGSNNPSRLAPQRAPSGARSPPGQHRHEATPRSLARAGEAAERMNTPLSSGHHLQAIPPPNCVGTAHIRQRAAWPGAHRSGPRRCPAGQASGWKISCAEIR